MKKYLMGRLTHLAVLAVIGLVMAAGPALADGKQDKQDKIKKTAKETLEELYKVQPSARKAIQASAGYAVFSNFGMKILVAGSGSGKGMAVDNKTNKITYMKMIEVQAGLGIGAKKFKLVWVFENKVDLDAFINSGWELGGQTSAAAQLNDQGKSLTGAMSVKPGVWLYQMIGDGLAVELTAKGTKYYKDDDLN
jgi:lipid-binding SYLF domain-containing protein